MEPSGEMKRPKIITAMFIFNVAMVLVFIGMGLFGTWLQEFLPAAFPERFNVTEAQDIMTDEQALVIYTQFCFIIAPAYFFPAIALRVHKQWVFGVQLFFLMFALMNPVSFIPGIVLFFKWIHKRVLAYYGVEYQ